MSGTVGGIAATAWVMTGVVWLAKLAVVWASGGPGNNDDAVAVLFIIGAGSLLTAAATSGFLALRRFGTWAGIAGVPIGIVLAFVAHNTLDSVLKSAVPASGWLEDELGILGGAVISLAIGIVLVSRVRASRSAAPAEASAP